MAKRVSPLNKHGSDKLAVDVDVDEDANVCVCACLAVSTFI